MMSDPSEPTKAVKPPRSPARPPRDERGAAPTPGDAPDPAHRRCLFCGATFEPEEIIRGAAGAICRSCVYSLSARMAETEGSEAVERDPTKTLNLTSLDDASDQVGADDRSAHDYPSRIDLAVAYREMGRTQAAITELLAAIESALLCGDYESALRCVGLARRTADSPAVRDRICEILGRHAPRADSDED